MNLMNDKGRKKVSIFFVFVLALTMVLSIDVGDCMVKNSCETCNTILLDYVDIITSADGIGLNEVKQNFNSQAYCTQNEFTMLVPACVITPNFNRVIQADPNVPFGDYSQNGGYINEIDMDNVQASAESYLSYDENRTLLKSHSECNSYNAGYVYYICNFNNDIKYTPIQEIIWDSISFLVLRLSILRLNCWTLFLDKRQRTANKHSFYRSLL